MTRFPYATGPKNRRVIGKPAEYRGWTIWRYQVWCQQTGAPSGEWRDLALAINGEQKLIGGDLYSDIDAILDTKKEN